MTILLATGKASTRAFLLHALASSSLAPQWVTGNQSIAEQLLAPNASRIAVLDRAWPGEDALAVCRYLRTHPSAHGLYLLLLTRTSAPEEITRAFNAGFDACLTPPYNAQVLAARLRVAQRVLQLQNNSWL